MSLSYTLLRNQLNSEYIFIRPQTNTIISRAINSMENNGEEFTVLRLSTMINQIASGRVSDAEAIQEFMNQDQDRQSVTYQIFLEFVAQMF